MFINTGDRAGRKRPILFTSTKSGEVAASGGGTSNFLRADGTWQAPPSGGSGISSGTNHGVAINSGATTIGSSILLGSNQILVGQASADPVAATVGGVLTGTFGAGTMTFSLSTSAFANPTSPGVDLTGAVGSATTAMRSDAKLVLDQSIAPTWSGIHQFNSGNLRLKGATSGTLTVTAAATASGTLTLPAGTTDFSATGGAGQVVHQTSAGGAFTVSQVSLTADVSGILPAANGGTGINNGSNTITVAGVTSLPAIVQGDIWYGSASNVISALAKNATASRYLSNSGASNNPAWAQVDLTNGVTGVLPTTNGGTGTNLTGNSGGIPYFNSTTTMASSATWTLNTLLKGGGAGASPIVTGITVDSSNNVSGLGSLTSTSYLALSAPATKTGTSYTVAATDSSLVLNPSGTFTLTLPTASSNTGRLLYIDLIANFAVISASSNVVPGSSSTAGTAVLPAAAGSWVLLQSDGTNWKEMAGTDIIAPTSGVDQDLIAFSGTSGSAIQDSGWKMSHVGAGVHRICGGM